MSDRTYTKVQAQQKTLSGSAPKSSLLQRTCACGQHTIAGGECDACRREQSTLLRSQRAFGPPSAPGAVPGSSPAQEHGISFNAALDRASRFGHDFSRIPIHPPAAGVIQTKLAINQPGDEYEQEADRLSEQVMRMPEPQLQRACDCGGACPKCQTESPDQEHKHLQTKHAQTGDVGQLAAPPIVHEVLAAPGQPLNPTTRAFMEPRFGHDFSQVRVHTDAKAAESARAVNSLAYTVGQNMVFGAGKYAPQSVEGRRLLAHELTHVMQQQNMLRSPNSVQQRNTAPLLQRQPSGSILPCAYLLNAEEVDPVPARDRKREGIAAHKAIAEDFVAQVGRESAVRIEIENAASTQYRTEGCGDAAPSSISPVIFNPHSERSGLGIPDMVYWNVAGFASSFEVAEIKFATPGCLVDAEHQVDNYIEKGSRRAAWEKGDVYGFDKKGKRKKLTGELSFEHMPMHRFTPRPLNVTGRRFSVSWCGPGVILYKAIGKRKEEEEEERKRAAEAAPPVIITDYARTLNWLLSGLLPQLDKLINRGTEYVIIAPPLFYEAFVEKPIEAEMKKMYGLSARNYPALGFHNLGWTTVEIASIAILASPLVAAQLAAAAAAASAEGASITSLLEWKAAQTLVSTPGVKVAAAAAFTLYLLGKPKEAKAATGNEPNVETPDLDIHAVPIDAVASERKIMIGREVKYANKTYRVIGTVRAK